MRVPSAAVLTTLDPDGRPSELYTRRVADGARGAADVAGAAATSDAGVAGGGVGAFDAGVAEHASAHDASATARQRVDITAGHSTRGDAWVTAGFTTSRCGRPS